MRMKMALDLFIANYVRWSPEADVYSSINGQRKSYAKPDLYPGSTCTLYLQRNGRFVDVTETSGVFKESAKALGVTLWDFNEDGRLDIAVANDTQPNFLLESLKGRSPNIDAIGARIEACAGSFIQRRWVRTGSPHMSQPELTSTFGSGALS